MYGPAKSLALAVLKAPGDAPQAPAGSHASVETFRASPRYLRYRMIRFWLHAAFVVVAELVMIGVGVGAGEPAVGAGAVVLAVVLGVHLFLEYFAIRLDFELRYYIVTDRSLRVREGSWVVKEMTITHANVQNLRVVQGPLERMFGIATLEVDTAGGGGGAETGHAGGGDHTVRMAGIENAHAVRDRILGHLRAHAAGSGLGDPDDVHDAGGPGGAAARPASVGSDAVVAALRDLRDAARDLRRAAVNP